VKRPHIDAGAFELVLRPSALGLRRIATGNFRAKRDGDAERVLGDRARAMPRALVITDGCWPEAPETSGLPTPTAGSAPSEGASREETRRGRRTG